MPEARKVSQGRTEHPRAAADDRGAGAAAEGDGRRCDVQGENRAGAIGAALYGRPVQAAAAERQTGYGIFAVAAVERGQHRRAAAAYGNTEDRAVAIGAAFFGRPIQGVAAERQTGLGIFAVAAVERGQHRRAAAA